MTNTKVEGCDFIDVRRATEKAFEACSLLITARDRSPDDDFEFAADTKAAVNAAREALKFAADIQAAINRARESG